MTNKEHLDTLNPQMRHVFATFIRDCEAKGIKIIITQSYRSLNEQYKLHLKDKRNALPGLSAHQYGLAIDINAIVNGKQLKMASSVKDWSDSGIVTIAENNGLRWGGKFNGYKDTVHFDCLKDGDTYRFLTYLKNTYGANYVNIKANQINWKL